MQIHGPGLLLVISISAAARFISPLIASVAQIESLTIAIVVGILLSNMLKLPPVTQPGIRYSLKTVLKAGIILFGLRLNLEAMLALGNDVLLLVIFYVTLTLILAYVIGQFLKVNSKLAVLIGVGTGICGASAVVAMAPCIDADDDDAIVAVSIVSFLGAIGVIIYSAIANSTLAPELNQYAVWSGLSLHGVAHALAAAFAMGEKAGEIGTFVKMSRVIMLVPVSLALAVLFKKSGDGPSRTAFPMYVLGFIGLGILNSLITLPEDLLFILKKSGSFFILMAMTAMGLSVNFRSLIGKGMLAMVQGSILFLLLAGISFWLVTIFI